MIVVLPCCYRPSSIVEVWVVEHLLKLLVQVGLALLPCWVLRIMRSCDLLSQMGSAMRLYPVKGLELQICPHPVIPLGLLYQQGKDDINVRLRVYYHSKAFRPDLLPPSPDGLLPPGASL